MEVSGTVVRTMTFIGPIPHYWVCEFIEKHEQYRGRCHDCGGFAVYYIGLFGTIYTKRQLCRQCSTKYHCVFNGYYATTDSIRTIVFYTLEGTDSSKHPSKAKI